MTASRAAITGLGLLALALPFAAPELPNAQASEVKTFAADMRWRAIGPFRGGRTKAITGVPGFVSYAAFRTADGGRTVTACQDKAGTDESSNRAAAWVKENMTASVDPPEIAEGATILQF